MKPLSALVLAALALGLSGCVSFWNREARAACPADPRERLGAPGCIQATAAEGYEYAVLAALAYTPKTPEDFRPPEGIVESEACTSPACDGASGYQYRIFHRIREGVVIEKIIAYRGTDEGADWKPNLLGTKAQNRAALATFLRVRGDGAVPVSVTGDSLGGALAVQVSMCHPVHMRVALNASPRFYRRLCPGGRAHPRPADANQTRLLFSEHGEILGPTRWLGRNPDQLATRVNCTVGESPVAQHDVRRLAACMVHRAIQGGSQAARRYRDENRQAFEVFLPDPRD